MFVRCSFFSFLMIALAIMIGCASDDEPMEEIAVPEPEPEPDWADNTLTIEIGRSHTSTQLLERFSHVESATNFWAIEYLSRPDFPMAKRQYTIEVAVISMLKAGITKPATMAEIQRRYKGLGHRPLTMEEAIELRLQFNDQPKLETGHEMANFYVLPSDDEGDIQFVRNADELHDVSDAPITPLFVVCKKTEGSSPLIYIQPDPAIRDGSRLFDPSNEVISSYLAPENTAKGARFACVINKK